MREETAENRARTNLLKVLETRITTISKDFIGPEGELVERALRIVAKGGVQGAELADRHTEGDGTVRALVALEPSKLRKLAEETRDLAPAERALLRRRTEELLREADSQ